MQEEFVKVPIYPNVHWMPPVEKQRRGLPVNKLPDAFIFQNSTIQIDNVEGCDQGVSRKVGGRGYRFICRVSWGDDFESPKSKFSVLWYDDFYDEWFVEVPRQWAERMGVEYQDYICTAEKSMDS